MVRSPTNDATANVAFRPAGLRQLEDSIVSTQRHITPEDRGSRSMNSRIFFSVTIRTNPASHNGNQESTTSSDGLVRLAVLHQEFEGFGACGGLGDGFAQRGGSVLAGIHGDQFHRGRDAGFL